MCGMPCGMVAAHSDRLPSGDTSHAELVLSAPRGGGRRFHSEAYRAGGLASRTTAPAVSLNTRIAKRSTCPTSPVLTLA
jgi:hypothetical protein